MAKKRICLALQGGGAHGAFTWGVLDGLLEEESLSVSTGRSMKEIAAGDGRVWSSKQRGGGKKARAKKAQLGNVVTVLGTDRSVELPGGAIDFAFICDVYHHFEFPTKMMKSIHQALKPKGRVALVDFVRIEGESSDWTLEHVRAGLRAFS